jgi:ATPase subunit of ABC transporter with duplicated ATPase domains
VAWLERFLDDYPGTVLCVTHDRYFLDNVAGWILEIDGGQALPFQGNYVRWLEAKMRRLELAESRDRARAKLMQRELEWVRSNAAGQQKKSKARLREFDRMSAEDRELQTSEGGALLIPQPQRTGGLVLEARGLRKVFDGRVLFRDVSFTINSRDVVGVVGPNGCGKTTLIRTLLGELQPDEGTVATGQTLQVAFSAQGRDSLDNRKSVWREVCGEVDYVRINAHKTLPARNYLAQFNFKGLDQEKLVGSLSGGERNRLQLARALARGANLIVLDEPTNDLDVDTLRKLEEGLVDYAGAVLAISHDRFFLDRICTHILAFEPGGFVRFSPGNYSSYVALRRRVAEDEASLASAP